MFLKKLVLNGFKTFCDISEVNFVKGVSAIVGPNGCGKSNVVDSIKWVIGEQKSSSLRASSMTDVIFKGTEHKRALSRAEVKLVLSNDNNILPIDYDEVEVSRVIYATGESDYFINKEKVRLKDVQHLFFDTGVGKSAYSVMEQGKIDMILSTKPEDRRYIIEEAAGITKYKVKRNEAMSNLRQADENILRINDIIKEVKSQYEHTKNQAEKARRFKQLRERELALEIELNLTKIIKNKELCAEQEAKIKTIKDQLIDITNELEESETGIEDHMNELSRLESQKISNQRDTFTVEGDVKVLASKIASLKDQFNQYEMNNKGDVERLKSAEKKLAEINSELEFIDEDKDEIEEKIIGLMRDNDFYTNTITRLEEEISELNDRLLELNVLIEKNNNDLEKNRDDHKHIIDRLIIQIDKSLNAIDVNSDEITGFKLSIDENIKFVLDMLPKKRKFIDDILQIGNITGNSSELMKRLEELKNDLQTIESKVGGLDSTVKKYISTSEIFLNDIFNPDGFLQQKRSVEQSITLLSSSIKKCIEEIALIKEDISKKKSKKEDYREMLSELKINLSTLKEKRNSIDKDITRLISLKTNYESSKEDLEQKIIHNENRMNDFVLQIEQTVDKINQMSIDQKRLDEESKRIENLIVAENTKVSLKQRKIKELNAKLISKKESLEQLNIKYAEFSTTLENIYSVFYDNYSIDIKEYENKPELISGRDYELIRRDLSEVKQEISSLGSVNLMALEEYKILEDRYNLLKEQLDDLEKAKKDIFKMIEEINRVSEELFKATFEKIKENFHKLFKKLFDGGNADIMLTEAENILESGIEIIAQPPGQKNQNISLLSGGQRTMTAIALMFSTFQVKPSPFCILDEIDAALDEENVGRFINLVKDFKHSTQFVMITHNKKTIASADIMIGVTQEVKGVSKIVSARIAEQEVV